MTVEDKKEMLHNSFASHPVSRRHVWEELEKEILEELGGEMGCGFEDDFKINCSAKKRLTCRSGKEVLSTCAYFAEMLR